MRRFDSSRGHSALLGSELGLVAARAIRIDPHGGRLEVAAVPRKPEIVPVLNVDWLVLAEELLDFLESLGRAAPPAEGLCVRAPVEEDERLEATAAAVTRPSSTSTRRFSTTVRSARAAVFLQPALRPPHAAHSTPKLSTRSPRSRHVVRDTPYYIRPRDPLRRRGRRCADVARRRTAASGSDELLVPTTSGDGAVRAAPVPASPRTTRIDATPKGTGPGYGPTRASRPSRRPRFA